MTTTQTYYMTINPIDGGTDIVTAANDAAGVVWSGIDPAPPGQNTSLTLTASYEHVFPAVYTFPNENGLWSVTVQGQTATIPPGLPDGVYEANVSNVVGQGSPDMAVIIAAQHTPFEVVGMAFLDAGADLSAAPHLKAAVYADLTAEQAGLQILLNDGYPAKQMGDLIKDVTAELKILDYVSSLPTATADPSVVGHIHGIQSAMSAYVEHSPVLAALMPGHVGW